MSRQYRRPWRLDIAAHLDCPLDRVPPRCGRRSLARLRASCRGCAAGARQRARVSRMHRAYRRRGARR